MRHTNEMVQKSVFTKKQLRNLKKAVRIHYELTVKSGRIPL